MLGRIITALFDLCVCVYHTVSKKGVGRHSVNNLESKKLCLLSMKPKNTVSYVAYDFSVVFVSFVFNNVPNLFFTIEKVRKIIHSFALSKLFEF